MKLGVLTKASKGAMQKENCFLLFRNKEVQE